MHVPMFQKIAAAIAVPTAVIMATLAFSGALDGESPQPVSEQKVTGTTTGGEHTVNWTWDTELRSWTTEPICSEHGLWVFDTEARQWMLRPEALCV